MPVSMRGRHRTIAWPPCTSDERGGEEATRDAQYYQRQELSVVLHVLWQLLFEDVGEVVELGRRGAPSVLCELLPLDLRPRKRRVRVRRSLK